MNGLGRFFIEMRKHAGLWKWVMFAWLALALALNFLIHPHHAHIPEEHYIGFWAAFGFVGALVMGVILKTAVSEALKKPEDYYDKYEPGLKEDDNG
ncbi:MAG: hypothetical protein PWQ57_1359 [Desulfovibrionales bacterium]|nr:hypothetical protein [Desulfovibrionales bacterium]